MGSTMAGQKEKHLQTKRARRRFSSNVIQMTFCWHNCHKQTFHGLLRRTMKQNVVESKKEKTTGRGRATTNQSRRHTFIPLLALLLTRYFSRTRKNTKCSWCFYFPKHRGSGVSRARRRISSSTPIKKKIFLSVCILLLYFWKDVFLKLGTKYKVFSVLLLSQTQGKRRLHRVQKELPFFDSFDPSSWKTLKRHFWKRRKERCALVLLLS